MDMIQKKITTKYWVNKLEGFSSDNLNTSMELTSSEDNILIKSEDLSYFYKLTSDNHIAEFTILLTIFNTLLQRYFGECYMVFSDDLIPNEDISLLYRFSPINNKIFKQFLQEVKEEVQDVYKHKDYDLDTFEGKEFGKYTPYGFSYNSVKNSSSSFSLNITKQENKDIKISVLFSENFVKKELANHFLNRFSVWIQELEGNIEKEVSQIAIISDEEKEKMISVGDTTGKVDSLSDTIISLFQSQVINTPNNVALLFEGKEFTYEEINDQSNQLAHYLIEEAGISSGDFVGVKLVRTEKLLISLLAVLKTGATYVPIDVTYPEERIAYIESDSNCKLVIDQQQISQFEKDQLKYSKENIQTDTKSSDLAYIIYTSGTTGNPKGVMITHQNAVALINWAKDEFKNTDFEVVYAATSHCFDLSVFEFFYTLSVGKKIKLLDNALEIGEHLENDSKVLLNTVPSSIRNVLEEAYDLSNVSAVNLAGEPFPVDIAQKLLTTKAEIRNLYGPSEDTTYSTCYKLSNTEVYKSIPIGKPITNTQAYILDEHLQLLPSGAIGKLYVSGIGVAKGYLNRPELTDEKFIDNPYCPGERIYDTGDLARWLPDGNIEFLGRKDHQVKLRGYRIELGEIENSISEFSEDVLQAVVAVKKVKEKEILVGYYVENNVIDKSELRDFLGSRLPSYMIPTYFITIESVPLTPNGKVNKKSLSEITTVDIVKKDYVAPRDKTEQDLVNIWEEVLGIKNIGVKDNFFELGGHSLMISQIINKAYKVMGANIPFKSFYTNPTIEDIRKTLKDDTFTSIAIAPISDSYPITSSQHRLWLLSQIEESTQAYQIKGAVYLEGNVDIEKFKEAFYYVVNRHEILRTYFENNEEGILRQYILSKADFDFELVVKDFSRSDVPYEKVENYIKEQKGKGYDLSKAPLFDGSLLKVNDECFVFSLSMHHIISDGWSLEILTSEIVESYKQLQSKNSLELPDLPIQFKDYAVWLEETNTENVLKESKEYWLNVFHGELPVLDLPTYKNRPLIKTYTGKELNYHFSKETLSNLKVFSQKHHVTLFMTLMSGIKALLSRYSNQKDIIIGTPIAGREHPDLESQIGLYLNTLAIRTQLNKEDSFFDVLQKEKQQLLGAYSHQKYPFDKLVEELGVTRDTSRSPLFDVMVILQNQKQLSEFQNREEIQELVVSPFNITRETSQFDLSFAFIEKEDLSLHITYNTDIYEESFVTEIFSHLENLFAQVLVSDHVRLEDIDVQTKLEKHKILIDFNDTKVTYPKDKTIVDLFNDQVRKTPNQVALIFEEKEVTYEELDKVSSQLANYLMANYKIDIEDLVAVKLDRSEWLIISLLAVLKTGGAYVPIDPTSDASERSAFIENDSNCKAVINNELLDDFRSQQHNYDVRLPKVALKPENLMYVIYTSGSTGRPKGVMVEHKSLVNYITNQSLEFDFNSTERVLLFSNPAFDASIEQLFLTLLNGASLIIISKEHIIDPSMFVKALKEYDITHFHSTPTYLQHLNDLKSCEKIRRIVSGGEACSKDLIMKMSSVSDFYNKYGPTETTISSTLCKINKNQFKGNIVSIGSPIANTQIYILSEGFGLLPVGVVGEICISGEGLSRGYLNQPELTSTKFVENPYVSGKKIYKTGDLGRWLPDGTIEFIGRKDDQVKIRGYRIELGEIENVMLSQNFINQCSVVTQKVEGDEVIVAYLVAEKPLDKKDVRLSLSKELPDYMLPSYYVEIDAIPLTPNGKVDKKALPQVGNEDIALREYVAPTTDLQIKLVSIWESVLGVEGIGITDNFFELGGHSLKITLLVNKIKQHLDLDLSVRDMFLNPTIKGVVSKLETSIYSNIPKASQKESYSLTSSQRRIWVMSQFEEGNVAYNIPVAFTLNGRLDLGKLSQAFTKIVDRHEVLRTIFKESDQEEVRQHILEANSMNIALEFVDISSESNSSVRLEDLVISNQNYVFDLCNGPLFKGMVIKLTPENHVLLLNMHHIIGDGWSMEILSKEFITVYNSLVTNQEVDLCELSIQYKDYAEWQTSKEQLQQLDKEKEYWHKKLSGNLPVLELPVNKMRPKMKTYNGDSFSYSFSQNLSTSIQLFSKKHGASLFMTLMSGINGLLSRYTNTDDIIIGTPVAGRNHLDLEQQIGLYLNTLAIRTQFDKNASFEDLLSVQKSTLLDAYSNQEYPFDTLVDELVTNRNTGRSALFDVMVVLQNQHNLLGSSDIELEELSLEPYLEVHRKVTPFDLSFIFSEQEGKISLHLEYNTDIYDAVFIEKLVYHLESFLENSIDDPSQSIANINLLKAQEEHQLLYEFNTTDVIYPKNKTVVDIFIDQANKTPNSTAIFFEGKKITYKELDELSNELANYLKSNYTLDIEDLISVKLERSEWLIISLLAILKLGCAYVPIDPNYPEQRISFIEKDSNCKLTIDTDLLELFKSSESQSKELPKALITSTNLAYVIYTSGSTGKPKGVMIEHGSLLNLCFWHIDAYDLNITSRGSLFAGSGFDASVWEIYPYLLSGGSLYPIESKEVRYNVNLLKDFLDQHEITHSYLPTRICEELVFQGLELKHTKILTGGEALKLPEGVKNLKIYNNYGPSENTVVTTSFDLKDHFGNIIPIGRPISNTKIYILSDSLRLQPVGVVGELCVSGAGLSRGYLNHKEMTSEKFISNPFIAGERLYKTGDLARWLPNGTIEYIGRKDDQIKIRGYRIELGEIENVIASQSGIEQALVQVDVQNRDQTLAAYIVSKEGFDKQALRASLSQELPDYMIPSYYVSLDFIPLTANGKVDKHALPLVRMEDLIQREYVAPTNEIEEHLVSIWEDVLGIEKIGITDNFFELGGNSLKATILVNRINKTFETRFSIQDLYDTQEIVGVSTKLKFIVFQNQLKSDNIDDFDEVII
ncbi:amino acid adenylation domain-containing protein [Aquimarina litoralis]|nr:non-ribosomal peptide synthetase [Aquimarina litoralis]MBW1295660.1 amino acid adenylation domain-containing protein [Aquimarina litoralis]